MKTEQELLEKLRIIDTALRELEENTDNIIRHGFTEKYWEVRKEVLADLRDRIGPELRKELREFIDGKTAKTSGAAHTAASTKTSTTIT